MSETPIRTAEDEIIVDEATGETMLVVEHWRQGDRSYRIVHERTTVQREDAHQAITRTFSKYKMVSALIAADVWPQVKAWIEGVPGAYDLYLAAEDISEDEPLLAQGIAAVKEMLGWTDAQVEAVLAASVKE